MPPASNSSDKASTIATPSIRRRKDPKFDLKLHYNKTIEVALIISLVLCTGVFLASKQFQFQARIRGAEQVVIKAENIPVTQHIKRPPPPKRPAIPIEDPEMNIESDVTIQNTDWDIQEVPPPPPPILASEEEAVSFFAVEEKPQMIGGIQALTDYINSHNLYPEMARTAESNGDVIVQFTVTKTGDVTDPAVTEERPTGLGFGDAAVKAILAMKFTPGKQRDKPVPVRMQQTIRFRIK
jgi:protein TonB